MLCVCVYVRVCALTHFVCTLYYFMPCVCGIFLYHDWMLRTRKEYCVRGARVIYRVLPLCDSQLVHLMYKHDTALSKLFLLVWLAFVSLQMLKSSKTLVPRDRQHKITLTCL